MLTNLHESIENELSKLNDPEVVPIFDDAIAEADLLQTSLSNLEIILDHADKALTSPTLLGFELAPPVCAVERAHGYDWFSVTLNSDSRNPLWAHQIDSRVILREQLSIMEHVLTQLVFGNDLACYSQIGWHRPINACPSAEKCMGTEGKQGIEFCDDPAWRQLIGLIAEGSFSASPSNDLIPGIEAAIQEFHSALRGEGTVVDRARIDFEKLGLDHFQSPRNKR
jgi:hypothetical protein